MTLEQFTKYLQQLINDQPEYKNLTVGFSSGWSDAIFAPRQLIHGASNTIVFYPDVDKLLDVHQRNLRWNR